MSKHVFFDCFPTSEYPPLLACDAPIFAKTQDEERNAPPLQHLCRATNESARGPRRLRALHSARQLARRAFHLAPSPCSMEGGSIEAKGV